MLRRGAWSLCRQVHTNVNQNAFSDKVALVTGASRGIGLAIAESFAQRGAKVILVSQQPERAKAVEAGFVSRFGTGHQSIALDISNRSLVAEAFKNQLKGVSIDFLVNAAGISRDGLLIQLKDQDILDTINTNLIGTISVSQYVAKGMIRKRSGCIINITSGVGIQGNAGQSVYSASKAGVIGFTKALAKELGHVNVRVNCIAPGFIETDMTNGIPESKKEELLKSKISLKRFGSTQDVADAAMFIAEANYMHGQTLVIDGGLNL
ncbi:3-oxoacyl-reductase [Umbelopsis sp. PMI_123]|nr:3-oxoacyl-reductase [Umbelopsis sp. PMI_123]